MTKVIVIQSSVNHETGQRPWPVVIDFYTGDVIHGEIESRHFFGFDYNIDGPDSINWDPSRFVAFDTIADDEKEMLNAAIGAWPTYTPLDGSGLFFARSAIENIAVRDYPDADQLAADWRVIVNTMARR